MTCSDRVAPSHSPKLTAISNRRRKSSGLMGSVSCSIWADVVISSKSGIKASTLGANAYRIGEVMSSLESKGDVEIADAGVTVRGMSTGKGVASDSQAESAISRLAAQMKLNKAKFRFSKDNYSTNFLYKPRANDLTLQHTD